MSIELALLSPARIPQDAQVAALEGVGGLTVTAHSADTVQAGLDGGTEVIDGATGRPVIHCVSLQQDPAPAAPTAWDLRGAGITPGTALVELTARIEARTDEELQRVLDACAHLAAEHGGALLDDAEALWVRSAQEEVPLRRLPTAPDSDVAHAHSSADDPPAGLVLTLSWYGLHATPSPGDTAPAPDPATAVRTIGAELLPGAVLIPDASTIARAFWRASATVPVSALRDDRQRDAVAELLVRVAEHTGAFAAQAAPISGVSIRGATPWYSPEASAQSLSTLRHRSGWHGLSPRPLWLLWLGEPYAHARIRRAPHRVTVTGTGRLIQLSATPQEALTLRRGMRRHLSRWLFARVLPHDPRVMPPPLARAWSIPAALTSPTTGSRQR